MNTASRMESTCTPGRIQVSESTWQLLKHIDHWRATGGVEVKGKGVMNTYFWAPVASASSNSALNSIHMGSSSNTNPPQRKD